MLDEGGPAVVLAEKALLVWGVCGLRVVYSELPTSACLDPRHRSYGGYGQLEPEPERRSQSCCRSNYLGGIAIHADAALWKYLFASDPLCVIHSVVESIRLHNSYAVVIVAVESIILKESQCEGNAAARRIHDAHHHVNGVAGAEECGGCYPEFF